MEGNIRREQVRYECLAASAREQVTVEGECALSGSMRDAVTVLSVQAQAHITQAQALSDRVAIRGRVCFQVLYTQGDLTRIRAIETTCDFGHEMPASGAAAGMRVQAEAAVLETSGSAASGRMALGALLDVGVQAIRTCEIDAAADVSCAQALCSRMQTITACHVSAAGEETALIREEFDLPDRLQVENVLTATGTAQVRDVTGGSGRIGVSGTVEVRVLHQPRHVGEALVETTHDVPFQVTVGVPLQEGERPEVAAEVIDVVADSVPGDKQRTLRVETEVRVRVQVCGERSYTLLEDLYTTDGPALEAKAQTLDLLLTKAPETARESVRIQAGLAQDAPPIDTVLAAFARPTLTSALPSGRRLAVEGVMNVTLLYLPVDSDIPYAVKVREPFAITFPVEAEEGVSVRLIPVECSCGPATSDRAELRCVLALEAMHSVTRQARVVTDVIEREEEKRERGFVLVWPAPGETRWETARRLRVPQESLRQAGANALMAFRR